MDIPLYAKDNFFSYRTDIPSIDSAKQYLEERNYPLQYKDLTVIIPDRNEKPDALHSTMLQLTMSNFLTRILHRVDEKHFRIKRIIVSDQSDPWIARALAPIAERRVFAVMPFGPVEEQLELVQNAYNFFDENCTNTTFLINNNITVVYTTGNCENEDLIQMRENIYFLI